MFKTSLILGILFIIVCVSIYCNNSMGSNGTMVSERHVNSKVLYLTPMIRAGQISEARNASKVVELSEEMQSIQSYSGYLTVNDFHNSNLFFWFFPAMNGAEDAPVLLWLQGGPGGSSLFGLFEENGPFSVSESKTLVPRNHTWVSTHSMLYVDNPVGTGFSFTDDDAGYSDNQSDIGHNMYKALLQFFTLFPEYQKNDFFITGESYAGKYVPAVSYVIHQNNPWASIKINLKGMAIGNGFIDPGHQAIMFSENLYQHGFIDDDGKVMFEEMERRYNERINTGDFKEANDLEIMMKFGSNSLIERLQVDVPNIYNSLFNRKLMTYKYWMDYLDESTVRAALHVGNRRMNDRSKVIEHLINERPQSVSPWLCALLDDGRYRVLLYSGQFDLVVPYSGTVNMARSLRWSGAEHFKNTTRTIWRVNDFERHTTDLAGYATSFGPLTVLLVRNAGHMVPTDQPVWAQEMITRFTSGKPF